MKENRNNYFNLKTNMHRKLTAHTDQRITKILEAAGLKYLWARIGVLNFI